MSDLKINRLTIFKPKKGYVVSEIHKSLIQTEIASFAFNYLKNTIEWQEGVKSKKGFTRYAKSLQLNEDVVVDTLIFETIQKLSQYSENKFHEDIPLFGIYLNYYVDGNNWTPNHKHPGTTQIVISLGGTRKFTIGSKEYDVCNGDVALFGSQLHGIPKQQNAEPRISIAFFTMLK
jgi:hypothetical protein